MSKTNTIAYRIRDCRRKANLTGAELGKIIGVTKATISIWENGKANPSRENMKKLSEVFNISLDYLYCRSDNERLVADQELDEIINKEDINSEKKGKIISKISEIDSDDKLTLINNFLDII